MIDSMQCETEMFFKELEERGSLKLVSSQELFLFMQHALGSYNEIWRRDGQEAEFFSMISHGL